MAELRSKRTRIMMANTIAEGEIARHMLEKKRS
jgi:hypothetical protein